MTDVTGTEATTQTDTTAIDAAAAATVDTSATETTGAEAGAGDTTVLGGDPAPAEEVADAATALPEKYELTPPEGMALDAETLAEADPVFRELKLNNEQAQKLVPVAAKFAERIAGQASEAANQAILSEVTAQRQAWVKEAQTDPDIGGAKWNETVELSAKALDALGYTKGSTFRTFLSESGLGNHPEMIRAFRKVGELVSEDGHFVRGDAAVQVKLPREAILYPNDVRNEGAN